MEMQKQLIMIGGIPSAGKTTTARMLKDLFEIEREFCTDFVYFEIGKELEILDFANPRVWQKENQELVRKLKDKYYRKMLPKDKKVLIEGYGLMFADDRNIIKNIYNDYKLTFFHKDISFEDWLRQKGVVDCEERKKEFSYLKAISTTEKSTITIK